MSAVIRITDTAVLTFDYNFDATQCLSLQYVCPLPLRRQFLTAFREFCSKVIDLTFESVELTPEDVEQDAIACQASDHANNLSGITVGGRAGEREETNLPPRSIPDKLSRSSPVTTGTVESECTMATTAVGGLWDASPASDAVNVYVDCGEPTTNTYRCPPCIDKATRRNDDRWKR